MPKRREILKKDPFLLVQNNLQVYRWDLLLKIKIYSKIYILNKFQLKSQVKT